jgi:hypothetical protein
VLDGDRRTEKEIKRAAQVFVQAIKSAQEIESKRGRAIALRIIEREMQKTGLIKSED